MRPQIAQSPLKTRYGEFALHVFAWSPNEQDNVLVLVSDFTGRIPIVRIQSACYTGEIFESLGCDCHWQLETSFAHIQAEGGIFIYMLCDGRGAGLLTKIRGMRITAEEGLDTADAYKKLGSPREYERAAYVLKHFGVEECVLLTNNARKISGLESNGLRVTRRRLESRATPENRAYLHAKASKLGHLFEQFGSES